MGTVVQLKNQINDSYFQLKDSVEDKLILTVGGGFRFEQVSWFFQPQSVFIVFGGVLSVFIFMIILRSFLLGENKGI